MFFLSDKIIVVLTQLSPVFVIHPDLIYYFCLVSVAAVLNNKTAEFSLFVELLVKFHLMFGFSDFRFIHLSHQIHSHNM